MISAGELGINEGPPPSCSCNDLCAPAESKEPKPAETHSSVDVQPDVIHPEVIEPKDILLKPYHFHPIGEISDGKISEFPEPKNAFLESHVVSEPKRELPQKYTSEMIITNSIFKDIDKDALRDAFLKSLAKDRLKEKCRERNPKAVGCIPTEEAIKREVEVLKTQLQSQTAKHPDTNNKAETK